MLIRTLVLSLLLPVAASAQSFAPAGWADQLALNTPEDHNPDPKIVEIDIEPFYETARLLYEGPWVAERYAAVGEFVNAHAETVDPVVRGIVSGATRWSAVDAFKAQYQLAALISCANVAIAITAREARSSRANWNQPGSPGFMAASTSSKQTFDSAIMLW